MSAVSLGKDEGARISDGGFLRHCLPLCTGEWSYSRRPTSHDPTQGWKLHVSATVLSAREVFSAAVEVLSPRKVLFKLPRTLEQLRLLNKGATGFSQVGKFLTVYPASVAEAVILARELHRATRGLAGPEIPFSQRYRRGSLVFYRYGVFRPTAACPRGFIEGPGRRLVRDRRAAGRAVPSWLVDPFRASLQARKCSGLLTRGCLAYKAKTQRGKGGVYEAFDLSVSPPLLVMIKEGRRHGETDDEGKDGSIRLAHETRVLRYLRDAGVPVPAVLREFQLNGHRYLVLECVAGRPLVSRKRLHPPRSSWRRAARVLARLGALLAEVHTAGWVWRDCKPSHILIDHGQWRLIDFESACRIHEKRRSLWASRPYARETSSGPRLPGTLEDDYALGVIAFQFLAGQFPPAQPRERALIYKRTDCPVSLCERIERLLRGTD